MNNFLARWSEAYDKLKKCTSPISAFTKAFEMTAKNPTDASAHREALLDVCVEKGWMASKHAGPTTTQVLTMEEKDVRQG